jgi:hypothetical protein
MKTLAVVIGIDTYPGKASLHNAVNDATAITDVFQRLGYDVIFKTDCNNTECGEVLGEFERRLPEYDASIFYFAGHGFEMDGQNFLASTECPIEYAHIHICNRTCIRLAELFEIYKRQQNKVHIVILDACRIPVGRGTANRNLSNVYGPKGTLIAFSTSPAETAKDGGADGHSIYTAALLKYIGREYLTVEKLFKNVRKTVHDLSGGMQTTWEHTSLIGDFYFNTGQLVHSVILPYDENVIKDKNYRSIGDVVGDIVRELKSSNWDRQNDAMKSFERLQPSNLNKNELFIIGRNILQASSHAYGARNFLKDDLTNLSKYINNGENHLLNGVLFEIYFDSTGEFRKGNFKQNHLEEIFALRHDARFKSSFDFIGTALAPYKDQLFYIPSANDDIIDVNVLVTTDNRANFSGELESIEVIEKVTIGGKDITEDLMGYYLEQDGESGLKRILSTYLAAPESLLQIHTNMQLKLVVFRRPAPQANVFGNW